MTYVKLFFIAVIVAFFILFLREDLIEIANNSSLNVSYNIIKGNSSGIIEQSITLLSVFILIALTLFFIKNNNNTKHLKVTSMFFYSFVVFHLLGSLILFNLNYSFDLLITYLSIVSFSLGVFLSKKNTHNTVISTYCKKRKGKKYVLLSLIIIFSAIIIFYYVISGGNPFVKILTSIFSGNDSAHDIIIKSRMSQYDRVNYFGQGYFEFLRAALLPIIVYYLYIITKKRKDSTIGLVALGVGVFFTIASGQRWPVIFLLVGFVYIKTLMEQKGINLKKIFIPVFFSLMILIFLTSIMGRAGSDQGLQGIVNGIIYRVLLSSHLPVYYSGQIYPNIETYQLGWIWLNDLLAYLPGADDSYGVIYSKLLGQSWGSAPLTILGEMYANFGILGNIFGFFIIGIGLSKIDYIYQSKIGKSQDSILTYAIFSMGSIKVLYGSGMNIIAFVILPLVFILFIKLGSSILKR